MWKSTFHFNKYWTIYVNMLKIVQEKRLFSTKNLWKKMYWYWYWADMAISLKWPKNVSENMQRIYPRNLFTNMLGKQISWCSFSMMVKWANEPSLAWSQPSFVHLTINEKLHQLQIQTQENNVMWGYFLHYIFTYRGFHEKGTLATCVH